MLPGRVCCTREFLVFAEFKTDVVALVFGLDGTNNANPRRDGYECQLSSVPETLFEFDTLSSKPAC